MTPAVAQTLPVGHPANQKDGGRVRVLLSYTFSPPATLFAVAGVEANIYFDNVMLVLNPSNYAVDVRCELGKQLQERWTFTPTEKDVGEHRLALSVYDEQNDLVGHAETVVRVTSALRATRASTLLIGDSLTDTTYSHYPQRLLELDLGDEQSELTLIGSRGLKDTPPDGPLKHEGYRGWTAQAFATMNGPDSRTAVFNRPGTGSPFIYAEAGATPALDFHRYCREFNGGVAPDAILICIGANDIFRSNDSSIDATIDTVLGHLDTLITEFRRVGPQTAIGIAAPPPSTRSQDGFRNYAGARKQTRVQYRRNHHRLVERMIAHFGHRGAERVYFVPVFVNLDTQRGYAQRPEAASAHSGETIMRVGDGVHPTREGHFQIADSVYGWLKAVAPLAETQDNRTGE